MRQRFNNIMFLLGVVSVVVMLFTMNVSFRELMQSIRTAGYWLPCAIVLWFFVYVLNALAWKAIMHVDRDHRVGFGRVLQLTITGFALNSVTPVGVLGSEPYRILELSGSIGTERATSSVLLFSMTHIFTHFLYCVVAIALFLGLVACGVFTSSPFVYGLLALALAVCLAGVWLFLKGYRRGMVMKFFGMMSHLPWAGRRIEAFRERNAERLGVIDAQIAALLTTDKRAFAVSLALEFASRALQGVEILFIVIMMGQYGGGGAGELLMLFVQSSLVLAFASMFSNILCFIPMQIGGREAGFALSISLVGMKAGGGLMVSILCRVREVVWIVVGLALMKLCRGDGDKRNGN